jgi:hypothetical protein
MSPRFKLIGVIQTQMFSRSQLLQVARIHARRRAANMMQMMSFIDAANVHLVNDAISQMRWLFIDNSDSRIATLIDRSSPKPTT